MGRSQVAYNQRKGRPGQKGRGGGRGGGQVEAAGPSNASKHQASSLGDNSHRFQEEEQQAASKEQGLEALEAHGNYSNQLAEQRQESYLKFDVLKMDAVLSQVPLNDLLSLPLHLITIDVDDRRGAKVAIVDDKSAVENEQQQPELIATLEQHAPDIMPCPSDSMPFDERQKSTALRMQGVTDNKEEEKDDEDNMESWLDNVIS